jgi:hypothetical protein
MMQYDYYIWCFSTGAMDWLQGVCFMRTSSNFG